MDLFEHLNKIPSDKVAHFAGGGIIAAVAGLAGIGASLGCTAAIAVAKELWDRTRPNHTADPMDALATIAGGIPVWVLMAIRLLEKAL